MQFALKKVEIDYRWNLELSKAMAEFYSAVTSGASAEKMESGFVRMQILLDRRSSRYSTLVNAAKALLPTDRGAPSSYERMLFLDTCQDVLQDRKILSDEIFDFINEYPPEQSN